MDYQLRKYQEEGRDFIWRNHRVMLAYDMGLGKTLTTLAALQPHMLPALIVAPLRVAKYVWPEEIEQFGFPFSYSFVHGAKKLRLLSEQTDLKIINPEGLGYLFRSCRDVGFNPFKTVVVDECSLYKNCTSKRWKYLRALIDAAEYRILLTGTPGMHHEMFGQIALLDDAVFGSYREFAARYLDFDYFGRPSLVSGAKEAIETLVAPLVLRHSADEHLDVPPIMYNHIKFDLPLAAQDRYTDIDDGIEQISENKYAPLRTACSGFVYLSDTEGSREVDVFDNTKLDLVNDVRDSITGGLLVVTNFRHERVMLQRTFDCPFIDGESRTSDEEDAMAAWNAGQLRMLCVHPRAVGHGLRLEKGGHTVLWYSPPDSLELFEQTNARLHRYGQEYSVTVHMLIAKDTIEETILYLLRNKVLSASTLLAALKQARQEKTS